MAKSGRAMYGWPNDKGGVPPDLKNIKTSPEKVMKFVQELVGHHDNISLDVRKLLVANGIRWYTDFVEFLKADPGNRFSLTEDFTKKNLFMFRFHEAMQKANISPEELMAWRKEIKHQYHLDNFHAHPTLFSKDEIKDMPLLGEWSWTEYCASISQKFKDLSETAFDSACKIEQLEKKVDELTNELKKRDQEQKRRDQEQKRRDQEQKRRDQELRAMMVDLIKQTGNYDADKYATVNRVDDIAPAEDIFEQTDVVSNHLCIKRYIWYV